MTSNQPDDDGGQNGGGKLHSHVSEHGFRPSPAAKADRKRDGRIIMGAGNRCP